MKKINKKTIIVINTAAPGEIFVALFDGEKIKKLKKKGHSDKALSVVDQLLKKNKTRSEDIRGVAAVSGPGSFTAVRQGVVVANTLGYLFRVPVVGIKLTEFKTEDELLKIGYKKVGAAKRGSIILPFYGGEPHITKPKKWK
jgi:tRNA A37 threonylcarbamoyladenosine modification protein TsaB